MTTLVDREFLRAVASGHEPEGHLSNLRYAWILTSTYPVETAESRAIAAIDRRAQRCGGTAQPDLTRAWVRVVADAVRFGPEAADFETFLSWHPQLLNRDLRVSV